MDVQVYQLHSIKISHVRELFFLRNFSGNDPNLLLQCGRLKKTPHSFDFECDPTKPIDLEKGRGKKRKERCMD